MERINLEQFNEIRFGSIYDADNVMATNDECWEEFEARIGKDDKVIINCKDVNLMRPWNNEIFKRFIKEHTDVYFKIFNDEKMCNSINLACDLMGLSHRAIPEKLLGTSKKVDEKLIKEEEELNELISLFSNNGKETTFDISTYCDSIGSGSTIDFIAKAINKYLSGNDVEEITIDARNVYISNNLVDRIIDIMRELNRGSVTAKFISDDKELNVKIEMKKTYKPVSLFSNEQRLMELSKLPKNYPCMLIRYKNNRAKDEFGRLGRGVISSCRACIIKSVDEEYIYVEEYNGNDFYTYEHMYMERDGNVPKLKPSMIRIKLQDVGYSDFFLGEKYHITRAIQESAEDSCQMYVPNSEGYSTSVEVTIPERMKMVFDSWEVEYNKEEIDACIRKTKDILGIREK